MTVVREDVIRMETGVSSGELSYARAANTGECLRHEGFLSRESPDLRSTRVFRIRMAARPGKGCFGPVALTGGDGIAMMDEEGLKALAERPDSITEERPVWRGPYIADLRELSDPWGNELQYKCPGDVNTNRYDLWSNGPDGRKGTDDDIGNWK